MSEIAKQSVLTLRMISVNPKKQIRLKLYLPITSNEEEKTQIIVLFVNRGATMGVCKQFVEDTYPHNVLKGKIKQLCIADDDGDIDEDFPPINNNQDITTLGVQNFWVDRIFDDKRKPSVIYSEKAASIRPENIKIIAGDKHKDTMKEKLINRNESEYEDDDDDDDEEEQQKKCCWCCFSSRNDYDEEDDDEQSVEYSDYQKIVLNESAKSDNYRLMSPQSDETDPQHRRSNVQYASL